MTFDKLRLSIFEAYQNEEISRETCQNMLESVMDMEGNHIVAEAEAIRADFMGVALECANGGVEFAAFEKKAETFGDKVKGVWEKFKKWLGGLIDSIKAKLGFKKKWYVEVNENILKLAEKVKDVANGIAANADPKALIGGVVALIGAGVGIFMGTRKKRVSADDAEKKMFGGLNALKKITDWWASKSGNDQESTGIIGQLRKLTKPFTDAINELHIKFNESRDEAKSKMEEMKRQRAAKKAAKNGETDTEGSSEAADEATPEATPAEGEKKDDEQVEQSSANSDFADGNMFGESTGDFDLDAMLADLGI